MDRQQTSDTELSANGAQDRDGATSAANGLAQLSGQGVDDKLTIPGLAHDLRNFLAPIHNAVQVLKLRGEKDADLRSLADLIDRQVSGIRKLVDRLADAKPAAEGKNGTSNAAQAGATFPVAAGASAKQILIVDDNAAFRISLAGVLQDMVHTAATAADGAEALQIARGTMPQIVFLDINMPGLNGYELARRFRAEFPSSNMRLIMLSGDTLSDAATRAAKTAGFDECIDKLSGMQVFSELLADPR